MRTGLGGVAGRLVRCTVGGAADAGAAGEFFAAMEMLRRLSKNSSSHEKKTCLSSSLKFVQSTLVGVGAGASVAAGFGNDHERDAAGGDGDGVAPSTDSCCESCFETDDGLLQSAVREGGGGGAFEFRQLCDRLCVATLEDGVVGGGGGVAAEGFTFGSHAYLSPDVL